VPSNFGARSDRKWKRATFDSGLSVIMKIEKINNEKLTNQACLEFDITGVPSASLSGLEIVNVASMVAIAIHKLSFARCLQDRFLYFMESIFSD